MPRKKPEEVRLNALGRIAEIQRRITEIELLCSGTLVKRKKLCGKEGCRCVRNPKARHGPYYEWGFMKEGSQAHRMVSPEQAAILRQAIANYRAVRRLLRRWETQTVRILDTRKPRNR